MSKANIFLILILLLSLIACEVKTPNVEDKTKQQFPSVSTETDLEKLIEPSVDTCENQGHRSILKGDPHLDSNAFELEIYDENDRLIKSVVLDLPFSLAGIRSCTSNYTVVGFSCGGPCYSDVYVPHDNSPKVQLGYGQITSNNEHIVVYNKGEDFQTMILHNLKNSKEQIVRLPDFNDWHYGHLDSIWMVNKTIHMTYVTDSGKQKTKTQLLTILK